MAEGSIADVLAGRATWALVEGDAANVTRAELHHDGTWVDVTITDPPFEAEAHTSQRRLMAGTRRSTGGGWKEGDLTVAAPLDFAPISEAERDEIGDLIETITRRWSLTFCQVEATQRWAAALTSNSYHRYVRTCIYVKEDPQPQMTGDRPGMGYECMVVTHPKGKPRWNGGGRCGVFSSLSGKSVDRRDGRSVHPTQKPTELMMELVGLFSEPSEVVFDPFAGSGTTGVACIRLGRRFIGIEREPKYAAVARERLRAEERGLSLREARAGQSSIFDLIQNP